MDEITERCEGLRLSEREGSEIDLSSPAMETGCVLVGKFCTKRRVSLESVARVLKSVWRTEQNFEVCDLGNNKVLFHFMSKDDLDRVLLLSPWSFDKYLLILHNLKAGESVSKLPFDRVSFWVQIHGLPTLSQTKEVVIRIGESLGRVEKVDVEEKGFCRGGYLRIRVSLDITLPLCRGRMVRKGGTEKLWVDFRYERLPIFCYWCGKVDHDERDCLLWIRSKETIRTEDKQFGPWLRATQDRTQKPQLIVASPGNSGGGLQPDLAANPGGGGANQSQKEGEANVVQEESHVADDVGSIKADMGDKIRLTAHRESRILQNWQDLNFEKQLQEIDTAIMGTTGAGSAPQSKFASDSVAEKSATTSPSTSNTVNARLASHNGLSHGPETEVGLDNMEAALTNVRVDGLGQLEFQDLTLFVMGTDRAKTQSETKISKGKGHTQKKNQLGRKHVGKENMHGVASDGEKGDAQRHETVMEVDVDRVGLKRKDRLPLEELDMGEYGKK